MLLTRDCWNVVLVAPTDIIIDIPLHLPLSAMPVITILTLRYLCYLTLVSSSITGNDDSTGAVIQRMIEAKHRFIREDPEGIQISTVTKRHFQLQINSLQNAPRNVEKLEQIIKAIERENEKAMHFEVILSSLTSSRLSG
jgi:hypothetical protein